MFVTIITRQATFMGTVRPLSTVGSVMCRACFARSVSNPRPTSVDKLTRCPISTRLRASDIVVVSR